MTDHKPSLSEHIVLTSHPDRGRGTPIPIQWGAADPKIRGPIVGTLVDPRRRNAIGTHAGSFAIYRALAVATGSLVKTHRPDLTDTSPVVAIGPHPSWSDPEKIVSLDPFGAVVSDAFAELIRGGIDIRPTIAITRAHINMPEIRDAVEAGRLREDSAVVLPGGVLSVHKAAVDQVWYLPGVARRFRLEESHLRHILFEQTGGMFPELVTRPDLSVFLPPIAGQTIYLFGALEALADSARPIAVRVHDECSGSDVFGSDICTCRPYLAHGIEVCARTAQEGGLGIIVYNRKEGRALGEVTKFLVYNARKRQPGGDRAADYFNRTECVAGVPDMRFQELMPDILHWLGVTRIDRFVSMSDMKSNAIRDSGIQIVSQVEIPPEMVPADAQVEMDAKKAAGYYTRGIVPDALELSKPKGRGLKPGP